MGCSVVCSEFTNSREQADAIGWNGWCYSILVECKTSRADFLRDKKKSCRRMQKRTLELSDIDIGLGAERWYLTNPGIVKPEEVPDGWYLAEVRGKVIRQIVKPPKGKSRIVPRNRMNIDRFREEMTLLISLSKRALGLSGDEERQRILAMNGLRDAIPQNLSTSNSPLPELPTTTGLTSTEDAI